ncbi:hypothetical protein, partial [Rhodoblastus sp.]|uniref:hypothetical protein n=1 Tax=Rhodoblastus sp. TaxID=1962975 RepID=UPI0035B406F9
RGRRAHAYAAHPHGGGRSSASASHDGAPEEKTDSTRTLASLGISQRTQTAVLKAITPAESLNTVGSTDDKNQVGATSSRDDERDYTKRIVALIEKFKKTEKAQSATGEGDITEHAILQAVDDAYKHADLERFSTFVGEDWTQERLRVLILERVDEMSDSMLRGTNKGRVSMEDVREATNSSAEAIYNRLFELSELLAENHSSALFVQLLYQSHGDAALGAVRENIERSLARASARVSGDFDGLIRRDARAYALNYRKQRIIFDCLSENIVKVTTAVQGIASIDEIDKRIGDLANTECKAWVNSQFMTADKKLLAQQPVPLRAVWTKTGPADDPSMYSRPSSAL